MEKEDPAARKKGDALEDLLEDFIRDFRKTLRKQNIASYYIRNPSYSGRGRTNIDFLLIFRGRNKIRYYFYIDSKNANDKMKDNFDIERKIHLKFDREDDFWKKEESSEKIGLVVGNFRMNNEEIEELSQKNIHYLELGELGKYVKVDGKGKFFLDKNEKIYYDVIMRGRLMQFFAINTRNVFDSLPGDYVIEIKDEKNFSIIKDSESYDYNIDQLKNVDYLPVDYDNAIDCIALEKGTKGGVRIISPWKGISTNPKISVRISPCGTTLFKTSWGRARK